MKRSKKENFEVIWELSGAAVQHKYLKINGIQTSYVEAGKGSPLLLLHGAGLGSVVWYQVIKELSQHYRVICPDKPGYGESENPVARYNRPFYTDWLHAFVQALGLEEFDLVGNSQGGAVSIAYALAYPKQVKRLVLSNTAGISDKWSIWARSAIVGFNLLPNAITGWNLGRYTSYSQENIDDPWLEYSLQVVQEKGGKNPILLGMGRATGEFPESAWKKLEMPTLIIWGREEKLFPVWHAEKAHQLLPNSELEVIEKAGHLPFLDQPKEFNQKLMTFLNSHRPS